MTASFGGSIFGESRARVLVCPTHSPVRFPGMKGKRNGDTARDRVLIQRCIRGDYRSWESLIRRYERLVYSIAITLCPGNNDAGEVFHRVCVQLNQDLERLLDGNLGKWLVEATRRKCYLVNQARNPGTAHDRQHQQALARIPQIAEQHALERATERLPQDCRNLLRLFYGRSSVPNYADIASRLGIDINKVGLMHVQCLLKLKSLVVSI